MSLLKITAPDTVSDDLLHQQIRKERETMRSHQIKTSLSILFVLSLQWEDDLAGMGGM